MDELLEIIDTLRRDSQSEAAWTAYAAFLADNGRDDEAVVVRVFWPVLAADIAAGVSIEQTLGMVTTNAARLARRARREEERSYDP